MKKRKDCFFGVHFDFHANQTSLGIGEKTDGEQIRSFLREVKPDFIQCDVKGHGGFSSYPTKYGYPTPEIKQDILRIFRDATKAEDVGLYAHYSGLLDAVQATKHPDWCARNKEGEIVPHTMSVFSNYDKEILIPQLIELAVDYQLNGVWVDGECWATVEDYSQNAVDAKKLSPDMDDKDFYRQAFRDYVANYVEKVKAVAPDFEITSNWMYSQQMPEKPTVAIDYISGDVVPFEVYDNLKFGTRIIANQNKTWDLISWGEDFYLHYEKSALQLCMEATGVISVGGAFQVYCVQDYKGFMQNDTYIDTLKEVAKFCRAREEYCHKATMRKEVAVLLSQAAHYDDRERLFGRGSMHYDSVQGCTLACIENQYGTEVLLGYNALEKDISAYKAIIVPELKVIEEPLKQKLLAYAKEGGTLVVIGAYAMKLFAGELGYDTTALTVEESFVQLVIDGKKITAEVNFAPMKGDCLHSAILATTTGEGLGVKQSLYGSAGGSWPLARVQFEREVAGSISRPYGKGTLALVPFDLGHQYVYSRTYQMRDMLAEVIKSGYKSKKVKTNTHLAEVILTEKEGREFVQFINISLGKRVYEIKSFDEMLPLPKVKVEYERERAPKKVMQFPENKELPFAYKDGKVCFEVENILIHTIVEMVD